MMATQKQIKAIIHQQAIGKIDKAVEAERLSTDEASILLSGSGYKNRTVSEVTVPAKASKSKPDVEGIRFGLACKLVAQHYSSTGLMFWRTDVFDKDVHQAYDALCQAESTYRGS